MFNVYLIKNNL